MGDSRSQVFAADELALPLQYYIASWGGGLAPANQGSISPGSTIRHHPAKYYLLSLAAAGAVKKDFRALADAVFSFLSDLSSSELCRLSESAFETGRCDVEIEGVTQRLLPAHLELHEHQGILGWIDARQGCLSAAGAPSRKTTRTWAREGVTCVVSLLRESEPHFAGARDSCIAEGFRWEHAPLTGKGAVTKPSTEDHETWAQLRQLLPKLLAEGEHVVVHCAAGMHRTGTTVFSTLRRCGFSVQDTIAAVELMRPVTHGELIKVEKGLDATLWKIAEDLLCKDLA